MHAAPDPAYSAGYQLEGEVGYLQQAVMVEYHPPLQAGCAAAEGPPLPPAVSLAADPYYKELVRLSLMAYQVVFQIIAQLKCHFEVV